MKGHKPQVLKNIFNAVARLIGKHWRKRGSRQKAQELFDLWGIEIELEAAKKDRQRGDR